MSGLVSRLRNGIPRPHLHAAGTEEVKGQDMWLDNDDIRYATREDVIELLLNNLQTAQTRRSNMGHEGIPDLLVQCSSHRIELVCSILGPSSGFEYVGIHCHCFRRTNTHCDRHRVQWSCWSKISYRFPCAEQSRLWSVRSVVAHVQSCCDGHCLERSQRSKCKNHTTGNSSLTSYRFKEANAST
jgi:hypothetical protein